ncbi:MAG TPA: hypothetical protein VF852_15860 [Pseudolabrys sp.]
MNRRFILATIASLFIGAPAQAANWFEMNFWLSGPRYDNVVPPCEVGLDKIAYGFATKEGRFWNSDLHIVAFEGVRETAFDAWAPQTIPRRYCTGFARVSDGSRHRVNYWIGEDTGFIGARWGVEWCVVGLDRNWAYNPACKMAAP